MAELLVSFALLAGVVLALTGLFLYLLQSSSKSQDLTVGRVFAEARLEQYLAQGLYLASGTGSEVIYSHDSATQTTFSYRIDSTSAPMPSASSKSGYYVEVEVWWWSDAPGRTRAHRGQLFTKLGRLVVP